MCDTTQWTEEQHRAAKRQFQVYKQWIRPLINRANLYHLTDRPDGVRWDAVQYFDPASKKGVVFVFRGTTKEDTQTLKLKGLNPNRTYQIRFEDKINPNTALSGKHLMQNGLTIKLPETESSELVYLEEQ
jgi:alpha-galactosidase